MLLSIVSAMACEPSYTGWVEVRSDLACLEVEVDSLGADAAELSLYNPCDVPVSVASEALPPSFDCPSCALDVVIEPGEAAVLFVQPPYAANERVDWTVRWSDEEHWLEARYVGREDIPCAQRGPLAAGCSSAGAGASWWPFRR